MRSGPFWESGDFFFAALLLEWVMKHSKESSPSGTSLWLWVTRGWLSASVLDVSRHVFQCFIVVLLSCNCEMRVMIFFFLWIKLGKLKLKSVIKDCSCNRSADWGLLSAGQLWCPSLQLDLLRGDLVAESCFCTQRQGRGRGSSSCCCCFPQMTNFPEDPYRKIPGAQGYTKFIVLYLWMQTQVTRGAAGWRREAEVACSLCCSTSLLQVSSPALADELSPPAQ